MYVGNYRKTALLSSGLIVKASNNKTGIFRPKKMYL